MRQPHALGYALHTKFISGCGTAPSTHGPNLTACSFNPESPCCAVQSRTRRSSSCVNKQQLFYCLSNNSISISCSSTWKKHHTKATQSLSCSVIWSRTNHVCKSFANPILLLLKVLLSSKYNYMSCNKYIMDIILTTTFTLLHYCAVLCSKTAASVSAMPLGSSLVCAIWKMSLTEFNSQG